MKRIAEWRLVEAGEAARLPLARTPRGLERTAIVVAAQACAGTAELRLDGRFRSRLYRLLTFLKAATLLNPSRIGGCHDRA